MSKILYVGIYVSKKTLDIAITVDGKGIKASKKVNNNLGGYRLLEQWTSSIAHLQFCSISATACLNGMASSPEALAAS